jgi:hypothetical protein
MKKIIGTDRTDLAKLSWCRLKGFYRQSMLMLEVIEYIERSGLNAKLHASTSHSLLNISPRHRHDAKVHVLRISANDTDITIEMFGPEGGLDTSESISKNHLLDKVKEKANYLISEYELN